MSDNNSKLFRTAPDTIWLCASDNPDDFNECFHTGNIEDVTWSDDKATTVAIEYRKVTPNDGKLVLQASWTKTERANYTNYVCAISDILSAEISEFPGDERTWWIVRLQLVSDSYSTDFHNGIKARDFVVASLAEFLHTLSPNIIIVHDDTLPEFKYEG